MDINYHGMAITYDNYVYHNMIIYATLIPPVMRQTLRSTSYITVIRRTGRNSSVGQSTLYFISTSGISPLIPNISRSKYHDNTTVVSAT